MNTRIIGLVISREYLTRVKKKSFLILTFLAPILFGAMCILPSLIMVYSKEDGKKVAVVDNSGLVMPYLVDSETVDYEDCAGQSVEALKSGLGNNGYDAILSISALNSQTRDVNAEVFSSKPLGIDMTETMSNRINKAVEDYRIASYGIEGLESIMKEVKADVKLRSYTLDEEGKETVSESAVFMMVSMILGIIIYMFIAIFGGMVMSSVIEEKASRVVEVLISSVKATDLMFGKIIGIALVALTQFFLWIVLTFAIIAGVGVISGGAILDSADPAAMVEMSGMSAEQMETLTAAASEPEGMEVIFSTLRSMPVAEILICFVIFFVFGYMLYASLFSAIGSGAESEGDTQQLQIPITIPLLLGFFIAIYAFKAPDSSLVLWGSMIPFTSPIVMLARLPFGVPVWQILLSVVLLVATTGVLAWASAKIYRVGILMFGKKTTWKDLWKWFKQD
ncbi:MAG: ABC transporter permease [Bacteroidales bacterium]|nr:ABC transporter permease [Bacteroidales bacterium]